jgi:Putative membrane protein insertion efficiency factor
MLCIRLGCCLMLLSSLWTTVEAFGAQANPMRAPTTMRPPKQSAAPVTTTAFPTLVFDAYLRFFQGVISPVDGARSNMYPTGSDYARQAFKKHGALLGIVLTTERLMHEGNEEQIVPRIRKYGLWRIYDPVEANDWWWQNAAWVYTPRPDRNGGQ